MTKENEYDVVIYQYDFSAEKHSKLTRSTEELP